MRCLGERTKRRENDSLPGEAGIHLTATEECVNVNLNRTP